MAGANEMRIPQLGIAALVALCWGGAFYTLGSYSSVYLGLICALSLPVIVRSTAFRLLDVYAIFFVAHFLGYAWFIAAVQRFYQVPIAVAIAGFSVFAAYGALQFLLFAWLSKKVASTKVHRFSLDVPLGWLFAELIFYKPFDWYLAHTFTAAPLLIQGADLFGASGVGFVFVWVATILTDAVLSRSSQLTARRETVSRLVTATAILAAVLCYGHLRYQRFGGEISADKSLNVTVVQDNAEPLTTPDPARFREISRRYGELTRQGSDGKTELVVWPESSVMESLVDMEPAALELFRADVGLPSGVSTLLGTSRTDESNNSANSIAAITPAGEIGNFYDKRIRFPMAEGGILQAILFKDKNPIVGAEYFDVGEGESKARVLPIVCFESTIPRFVAARMRDANANLIIEFSNLNWFSGTIASIQHEVISTWRAVENRAPMLRVVNSGPSSLILPSGESRFRLQPGARGALSIPVPINPPEDTLYQFVAPLMAFSVFSLMLVILSRDVSAAIKRLMTLLERHRRFIGASKGLVLTTVGLLCSFGTLLNWSTVTVLGHVSGASPAPLVFNTFQGINYWAHDWSVELLGRKLKRVSHRIDAEVFNKIPGPHLHHMAYAIPFAFAPVYPREFWEPAIKAGFCESGGRPPILAQILEFDESVGSVKLTINERVPANGNPLRSWEYRVVCDKELHD
jgi:apolipoprotein N-acyltransferase